jgi:hypothetical protein
MKVQQFTKTNLRQINDEMEQAMKAVAAKYGLEIKIGNTRFSGSNASSKFEMMTISESGDVITKEAIDFNRYKNYKGIEANLGDSFQYQGNTYTIIGYKPRSNKYPILAKCSEDGKTYKLPINLVNRYTNG